MVFDLFSPKSFKNHIKIAILVGRRSGLAGEILIQFLMAFLWSGGQLGNARRPIRILAQFLMVLVWAGAWGEPLFGAGLG